MQRFQQEPIVEPDPTREAVPQLSFSAFIRARKRDILAAWEQAVRQMPVAQHLDRPALIDQVPDLLDRIAEMADELAAGNQPRMPADLTEVHALERLDEGFDLSQVVAEYDVLRDCIVRLWDADAHDPSSASIRALNQAIDRSVAVSIRRFTLARDRTLLALDRISAAALETRSLDELLDRLLHVLLETTAAVDTVTILLRDGDVLRIRATIGLEDEMAGGWSVQIGEWFAGTIAHTRQPAAIESAATDPLVASPSLRARGIKALYGEPMIEAGEVIGVAHMGSLTAATFSKQDQRLFAAFAHRATSAITLHMLREREQARRAELEAVIESIPDAVFIATASGVTRANRPALELAGWTEDDLGRPIGELARELEVRDLETGRPIAEQDVALAQALRGRAVTREVLLRHRKSGREIIARSSTAPIRQGDRVIGAISVNTDVTDTRRAQAAVEDALREQHAARAEAERTLAVIDTILAASSLGIAFLDTELRYVRINDAMAALNGLSAAEHVGRTVREVLGDPAADFLEPRLRRVLATRRPIEDLEVQDAPPATPDQVRSFVASYVPVVTLHGELLGVGGVVIEVTERKRLYEEAQRQARMREEVLAVVSHDLKNPLGAIHLAAAMLLEKAEPRARRHLETIHRAASRMDHLIGDLLDMASIQAGRLAVDRKPEDLDAIVREVLEANEPMAREKGLQLVRQCELPGARLCADRDRILQVFGNLVGNAIKFGRSGDTIAIRCERRGTEAELAVADTGPGISSAELPHIFDPYWSAKRYAKKGTGLGLYISKGIVEAHGGRIWAESRPGEGTAFYFTIPLA